MKIFESKYLKLYFFEECRIMEWVFTQESVLMKESDFKHDIRTVHNLAREVDPVSHLIDFSQFGYILNDDEKGWLSSQFSACVRKGDILSIASTVSTFLYAQIAIEDFFERFLSVPCEYFEAKEAAREWLMKDAD
ncbi:hypothetical protein V6R21_08255 [Limibacter armeniacum]|uniref:hypothetical protein n=1 Tax=Limibacter armeniacum TaxID=466084 RepID=UPI002FE659C8